MPGDVLVIRRRRFCLNESSHRTLDWGLVGESLWPVFRWFPLFRLRFQTIAPPVALDVIAVGPAFPKTVGDTGGALQAAHQGDDIHLSMGEGTSSTFVVAGKGLGRAAGWKGGLAAVNRRPGSICHRWLFGCVCGRVNGMDARLWPRTRTQRPYRARPWVRLPSNKRRAVPSPMVRFSRLRICMRPASRKHAKERDASSVTVFAAY